MRGEYNKTRHTQAETQAGRHREHVTGIHMLLDYDTENVTHLG